MTEKNIVKTLDAPINILFTTLSTFGIPTDACASLWNNYKEKTFQDASSILIEEVKDGNFNNIADDEKIALFYRFMQASSTGNAKINLRILAQLINSLVNGETSQRTLYANEFNRYAPTLESLSYEEIQILAELDAQREKDIIDANISPLSRLVSTQQRDTSHYSIKVRKSIYMDVDEFDALTCALQRTGFVMNKSGYGGENNYELTPFFDKIKELVDFKDALEKEKQ